jgi:hypothetical protein
MPGKETLGSPWMPRTGAGPNVIGVGVGKICGIVGGSLIGGAGVGVGCFVGACVATEAGSGLPHAVKRVKSTMESKTSLLTPSLLIHNTSFIYVKPQPQVKT